MLLKTELLLTLAALGLALARPRLGAGWFGAVESGFRRLARRQRLAVLVVGFAAIAVRLAVLPILPVPQPTISDEYSFYLQAETFVEGRLTNPTPALSEHFETLHVLQKPTYNSMFPPAQALFLAAGLALTGLAFTGVLLGVGLMCAGICWMLQGWFSPGWALLGGFLTVMRLGVFSYWADSYWGGGVAAFGGALVLGALPRILKWERGRDALAMAVGLAILANSRPYEGMILSLPVAAVMLWWLWKKKQAEALGAAIRRVVLPLALVVGLSAVGMGFYFWRVTGSPLRMPQVVERSTYAVAPYFLWESARPTPVYNQPALRHFYLEHELPFYQEDRTPIGLAGILLVRYSHLWLFYFNSVLTLPLLLALAVVPYDLRWGAFDWRTRFLLAAAAISWAGMTAEVFFFPHYVSPMTGLLVALVILAMRQMRTWRPRGRPVGRFLSRALPAICVLLLVVRGMAVPLRLPITPLWPLAPYNAVPVRSDRMRIEKRLESLPGKQMALVKYVPEPKSDAFVYNGPDIAQAKVIWAWDMGLEENEKLMRQYPGREVWMVDPATAPARVTPYQSAAVRAPAASGIGR